MVLAGWSLEDLAQRTGVTKQAWSKTLRTTNWSARQIMRAATAFGVLAGDLIHVPDDDEDFKDPDLWKGEDLA